VILLGLLDFLNEATSPPHVPNYRLLGNFYKIVHILTTRLLAVISWYNKVIRGHGGGPMPSPELVVTYYL